MTHTFNNARNNPDWLCTRAMAATMATRARALLARLNDPRDVAATRAVCAVLLLGECVLCGLIVWKVPYTEIDWRAYMDEVGGYLGGERDYLKLKGDTGPLVYPAGFVYIYAWLKQLTGGDIFLGQCAFVGVYVIHLAIVLAVYAEARCVPPWVLAALCLSKRIHSIFVLRLFNDCFAMAFAYLAVFLFQRKRWVSGFVAFSLGTSVKMNVLLMAPPALVLLVGGERLSVACAAVAAAVLTQLAVGYEFLSAHPASYVRKAFEFSRVFIHHWSVNFKFVPNETFVSPAFAAALLACHLAALLALAHRRWHRHGGGFFPAFVVDFFARAGSNASPAVSDYAPAHVARVLFEGNFVGIVFARSLHYQFYEWYYHTLPLLLWGGSCESLPGGSATRVALMVAVERCWNVFPSTPTSSLVLLAAHGVILGGIWTSKQPPATTSGVAERPTNRRSSGAARRRTTRKSE